MKKLPWIKLYARWYETMEHAELSPEALHTGAYLLIRASRGLVDDTGAAWLVKSKGKPLDARQLALGARWPVKTLKNILEELIDAGTIVQRDDGAYGFPNFRAFQESPDAERKRKQRATDKQKTDEDGDPDTPAQSHDPAPDTETTNSQLSCDSPRTVTGQAPDCPTKRIEVRGKKITPTAREGSPTPWREALTEIRNFTPPHADPIGVGCQPPDGLTEALEASSLSAVIQTAAEFAKICTENPKAKFVAGDRKAESSMAIELWTGGAMFRPRVWARIQALVTRRRVDEAESPTKMAFDRDAPEWGEEGVA